MNIMMIASDEQLFKSKVSSRLERWATREHLAQTYLLIANCFLALKSATNIISYVIDSKSLILEYNATLLFNSLLRQCLIVMNVILFGSSLLCLLALMLTLKHNTIKQKLIHSFTFCQILLTIITMLMMAHLWVSPIKVHLAEELPNWQEQIAQYPYRFEPDTRGLLPAGAYYSTTTQPSGQRAPTQSSSSPLLEREEHAFQFDASRRFASKSLERDHGHNDDDGSAVELDMGFVDGQSMPGDLYRYSGTLDRVQQALGCCGIEGPSEWTSLNRRLGLLAPSCCRRPLAMNLTTASEVSRRLATNRRRAANQDASSNQNPLLTMMDMIKTSLLPNDDNNNNNNKLLHDNPYHEQNGTSTTGEPKSGQDNLSNMIFYCPRDDERPGLSRVASEDVTSSGSGQPRRLTREEMLELQLAIEWTNESPRALLQQHHIVSGCQRAIDERDSRCLFAMRLSLLALVTLLFFNILAQSAAFEPNRSTTIARKRRATRKDSAISSVSVVSWPDWQRHQQQDQQRPRLTHLALNINNYNLANSTIPYNSLGGDGAGQHRGAAARVYAAEHSARQ